MNFPFPFYDAKIGYPPIVMHNIGPNSGASVPSIPLTVPAGGIPAGSLIVVCVYDGRGLNNVVTDSVGNTYHAGPNPQGGWTLYYAWNSIALLAGHTITYTKMDSTNGCLVTAFYATGIMNSADPIDMAVYVAKNTGQTGSPTITSGVPTQAGELFLGFLFWTNNGEASFNQMTGWAIPPQSCNNFNISIAGGNMINAGMAAQIYSPTVGSMYAASQMFTIGFKHP